MGQESSRYEVGRQADGYFCRLIVLRNGLEALLVSDPTLDKAAVSCSVGVGHLSDPVSQAEKGRSFGSVYQRCFRGKRMICRVWLTFASTASPLSPSCNRLPTTHLLLNSQKCSSSGPKSSRTRRPTSSSCLSILARGTLRPPRTRPTFMRVSTRRQYRGTRASCLGTLSSSPPRCSWHRAPSES